MRRGALVLAVALALAAFAWTLWPKGEDVPRRPPEPAREVAPPAPTPPPGLAPAPSAREALPAAGTPVEATPTEAAGRGAVRVHVLGQGTGGKPTGVRAHVRDAEGRESVREPGADGDAVFGGLPVGVARVWIDAPDYVGTEPEELALVAGRETVTTHALRAGARATGRVVAARTGEPVVGASVDAGDGGSLEGTSSSGGRASYGPSLTDAEGRFETALLPLGEIVTVTVRARGFVRTGVAMRLLPVDGTRTPLEIRLEPGGAVRGVVLDPDGGPAPSCEAFVLPEAWVDVRENPRVSYSGTEGGSREASVARADGEGRFVIEGLPLGVPLCATALHGSFARAPDVAGIVLTEAAPEATVTLRMRRPAAVVVTLRDPEDRPVVSGEVTVGEGFGDARGELDAGGTARITGLAPGATVLDVIVDGFVPVREEVTLEEGRTLERALRLSRGLSIVGAVVDEAGAPVGDVAVHASREGARRSPVARTRSAADGTFRIEGLEPGSHRLNAYAKDLDVRPSEPMSVPATGVRLVAQRLTEVRARLVAPAGRAPASVMAGAYQDGGGSASSGGWDDGRISWKLARGAWRLTVRAEGFAVVEREVTLAATGPVELGEIPLDVGATLEGVVTAPDGKGLPGVTLEAADPDAASAQTDADGRFRLEHLRRTKVSVDATLGGFRAGEIAADLSTPHAPVRLVLVRGALVTGTVRIAAGGPRPAELNWRATQLGVVAGEPVAEYEYLGDDDTFSVRLPAGRFALEIKGGEVVLWRKEVTLEEGKDVAVEMPLPAR